MFVIHQDFKKSFTFVPLGEEVYLFINPNIDFTIYIAIRQRGLCNHVTISSRAMK